MAAAGAGSEDRVAEHFCERQIKAMRNQSGVQQSLEPGWLRQEQCTQEGLQQPPPPPAGPITGSMTHGHGAWQQHTDGHGAWQHDTHGHGAWQQDTDGLGALQQDTDGHGALQQYTDGHGAWQQYTDGHGALQQHTHGHGAWQQDTDGHGAWQHYTHGHGAWQHHTHGHGAWQQEREAPSDGAACIDGIVGNNEYKARVQPLAKAEAALVEGVLAGAAISPTTPRQEQFTPSTPSPLTSPTPSSDSPINALSDVEGAKTSEPETRPISCRHQTSPQWQHCTGSFNFDEHKFTLIMKLLVEIAFQCPSPKKEGSQGPQYLQPGKDKAGFLQPGEPGAGFLQLIVPMTSQPGMKGAYFHCRTVRGKMISNPLIKTLKNALGDCGATSVEVQGIKVPGGGEREYVLDTANLELAGTKDLRACSTTIPLAVYTTKGGVTFRIQDQDEITIDGQVEITEVGMRTNPGGLGTQKGGEDTEKKPRVRTNSGGGGTQKKQRERGKSGEETGDGTSDENSEEESDDGTSDENSWEESDDGTSEESVEREEADGTTEESVEREEATDAQHPNVAESVEGWTIEDVCTVVQGLSQTFGDQASVYAAAMKEEEIDGKALLHLSAADLEELGVSPKHRSQLLARIQDLMQ